VITIRPTRPTGPIRLILSWKSLPLLASLNRNNTVSRDSTQLVTPPTRDTNNYNTHSNSIQNRNSAGKKRIRRNLPVQDSTQPATANRCFSSHHSCDSQPKPFHFSHSKRESGEMFPALRTQSLTHLFSSCTPCPSMLIIAFLLPALPTISSTPPKNRIRRNFLKPQRPLFSSWVFCPSMLIIAFLLRPTTSPFPKTGIRRNIRNPAKHSPFVWFVSFVVQSREQPEFGGHFPQPLHLRTSSPSILGRVEPSPVHRSGAHHAR